MGSAAEEGGETKERNVRSAAEGAGSDYTWRSASTIRLLAAQDPGNAGRDDFEGHRTRRVYALFAKTRAFDACATHPTILAVLDRVLQHYQLSAPTGIEAVEKGASRRAGNFFGASETDTGAFMQFSL